MKKFINCALALVAGLLITSCMKDSFEPVQQEGTLTLKVNLSEVATKAPAVGNSASMINDLVYAVYKTTATDMADALENWNEKTVFLYAENLEDKFANHVSDEVTLELLNEQNHIVLLWAQHDDVWVDAQGDDINLTEITTPDNFSVAVNSGICDMYAAFSGYRFIPKGERVNTTTIELTRPFAQINVASIDPANYNLDISETELTIKGAGRVFNVASQEVTGNTNVTYTWNSKVFNTDPLTVKSTNYDHYLAMGYVFANGNVTVDYKIKVSNDLINTYEIDNTISAVPVAMNYRTNIIGNLLTSDVKYNVELDKVWATPENVEIVANSAEAFRSAIDEANSNDIIVLGDDINLNQLTAQTRSAATSYSITFPADKNLVLDLNGHNITQTVTENQVMLQNLGTLTIVGDGKISATIVGTDTKKTAIENAGTLIIKDGTYTAHVVDAADANTSIQGGTFETEDKPNVAKGYVAEANEETGAWEVVEHVFVINSLDDLKTFAASIDKGESTYVASTIKLNEDINLYEVDENGEKKCFDPIGSYRFEKAFEGIFDGQGHTISNLNQTTWALNNGYYYNDCGLGLFGALVGATVKNLIIDNASISGQSALCGVVASYAENTTFENVTVKKSQCADYQYYAGGIVGWASGECKFIDCNVDATTTVATQWGDFDNSTGGVIGGAGGSAKIYMKDCNVACRIDSHNDVVSAYQWYAYRRCGMLIGNTSKTQKVGDTTYAAAPQLTCENVTVTYGDWANYTYCEFAGTGYPYVRVQAGVSCSAYSNVRYGHPTDANGNQVVDDNHVHNEGEDHHLLLEFDQLYGGGQGVYGTKTHEGVTVIYNNK